MELADKDSKIATIIMLKDLKENMRKVNFQTHSMRPSSP